MPDFDRRAAAYDRNTWHVRYAERLVELAAPTAGARVLDAATGTGFAAFAAARTAGHVLGVDTSAGMLDRARRSVAALGLTNVDLRQADATSLPDLPGGSFDLILCSAGLLYMPVRKALREWRRLRRPGGLVGFSTMREGFPPAAGLFREVAARYGLRLTDPATPLGTPQRCRQRLREAGFASAEVVEGTVEFSHADLALAWDAHADGPHHDAVAALPPGGAEAFRAEYTSLLDGAADRMRTAEVLFAFGR